MILMGIARNNLSNHYNNWLNTLLALCREMRQENVAKLSRETQQAPSKRALAGC
jgi:hypothetical protein